jgi:hypothetical protein
LLGTPARKIVSKLYGIGKYGDSLVLGSDSRLTSDNDLLGEMRVATVTSEGNHHHSQVIDMVTVSSADLIKESHVGKITPLFHADWIALSFPDLPNRDSVNSIDFIRPGLTEDEKRDLFDSADFMAALLCYSRRADLALVVKGGIPQIGDPDVMAKFPHIQTVAATLDGQPKRIQLDLARRIHQNQLKEPGLEVDELPKRKFVLW